MLSNTKEYKQIIKKINDLKAKGVQLEDAQTLMDIWIGLSELMPYVFKGLPKENDKRVNWFYDGIMGRLKEGFLNDYVLKQILGKAFENKHMDKSSVKALEPVISELLSLIQDLCHNHKTKPSVWQKEATDKFNEVGNSVLRIEKSDKKFQKMVNLYLLNLCLTADHYAQTENNELAKLWSIGSDQDYIRRYLAGYNEGKGLYGEEYFEYMPVENVVIKKLNLFDPKDNLYSDCGIVLSVPDALEARVAFEYEGLWEDGLKSKGNDKNTNQFEVKSREVFKIDEPLKAYWSSCQKSFLKQVFKGLLWQSVAGLEKPKFVWKSVPLYDNNTALLGNRNIGVCSSLMYNWESWVSNHKIQEKGNCALKLSESIKDYLEDLKKLRPKNYVYGYGEHKLATLVDFGLENKEFFEKINTAKPWGVNLLQSLSKDGNERLYVELLLMPIERAEKHLNVLGCNATDLYEAYWSHVQRVHCEKRWGESSLVKNVVKLLALHDLSKELWAFLEAGFLVDPGLNQGLTSTKGIDVSLSQSNLIKLALLTALGANNQDFASECVKKLRAMDLKKMPSEEALVWLGAGGLKNKELEEWVLEAWPVKRLKDKIENLEKGKRRMVGSVESILACKLLNQVIDKSNNKKRDDKHVSEKSKPVPRL